MALVQDAARRVLNVARTSMSEGEPAPTSAHLEAELLDELRSHRSLSEVINATGVLLHTNLGRAPIAASVPEFDIAVDLELDIVSGARGRRLAGLERSLCVATGAESALVVNNNAAAVLLAVSTLASGREVVVARGEMVAIGGSFRIPDVIVQGGAALREVGTTNRLEVSDLQHAIGPGTGAVLQVHPSNYRVTGFTASVDTAERAAIARRHGVPLLVDAGAGLLDERCPWLSDGPPPWLSGEPGVRQLLRCGADVVTFSADKLLGGPQGGIIVGRRDLIDPMRTHPLARAVRYDKVRAAYLEATLDAYHRRAAGELVPFWRHATATEASLEARAEVLADALPRSVDARVETAVGAVGAGCLAERPVPDVTVSLRVADPEEFSAGLRRSDPPVLATVTEGRVRLALRSVRPIDDPRLLAVLTATLDR